MHRAVVCSVSRTRSLAGWWLRAVPFCFGVALVVLVTERRKIFESPLAFRLLLKLTSALKSGPIGLTLATSTPQHGHHINHCRTQPPTPMQVWQKKINARCATAGVTEAVPFPVCSYNSYILQFPPDLETEYLQAAVFDNRGINSQFILMAETF